MFLFLLPAVLLAAGCGKDDDDPVTCPLGYSGANCATELTPNRVDLLNMSVTVSSTGWDVLPSPSAPDIFFRVFSSGGAEILETSVCNNATTCSWSGVLSFGPNETCTVRIFDADDFGTEELIGSFVLDVYQSGQGFPTTHTTTLSGVTATVGLFYVHL